MKKANVGISHQTENEKENFVYVPGRYISHFVYKHSQHVIRLSLGRRLVNLLPVAQRTNAFTNGVVDRPWVVSREFESRVHRERFLKKSEFPHVKNLINHSPWVPRYCEELRSRHVRPHTKTKNPAVQKGGHCYKA